MQLPEVDRGSGYSLDQGLLDGQGQEGLGEFPEPLLEEAGGVEGRQGGVVLRHDEGVGGLDLRPDGLLPGGRTGLAKQALGVEAVVLQPGQDGAAIQQEMVGLEIFCVGVFLHWISIGQGFVSGTLLHSVC